MYVDTISKIQFNAVCNKYKPNIWLVFWYKYFSENVEACNLWMKKTVVTFFTLLFLFGFILTVTKAISMLISIAIIIFSISVTTLVICVISAAILNYIRIRKIRNELGITGSEFNILMKKYS